MGALEAPLSSKPRFGEWLTFDLLLHLLPLLAGQQKVYMLSGDIFTEGVLVDTEIYRNLMGKMRFWIRLQMGDVFSLKLHI